MSFDHEIGVAPDVSREAIIDGHVESPGIPTATHMFRTDTRMGDVVDLTLSDRPVGPGNSLEVLSVGSSFGAEGDSVLARITTAAPNLGHVGLTGVDINPNVVDWAQKGKYVTTHEHRVRPAPDAKREPLNLQEYLPMFAVRPTGADPRLAHIDTNPLRAQHDVKFLHGDLRDGLEVPEADLILANNVLFHLTPNGAEKLVDSMADRLAPGGIMSFGANPKQVRMESNRGDDSYIGWRHAMGEKLAKIGIQPVLYDRSRKAPFVFRREA